MAFVVMFVLLSEELALDRINFCDLYEELELLYLFILDKALIGIEKSLIFKYGRFSQILSLTSSFFKLK